MGTLAGPRPQLEPRAPIKKMPQSRFRFLAYSYHTSLIAPSPGQYRAGIHPLPSSLNAQGAPFSLWQPCSDLAGPRAHNQKT